MYFFSSAARSVTFARSSFDLALQLLDQLRLLVALAVVAVSIAWLSSSSCRMRPSSSTMRSLIAVDLRS